jgi:hypothetical protein
MEITGQSSQLERIIIKFNQSDILDALIDKAIKDCKSYMPSVLARGRWEFEWDDDEETNKFSITITKVLEIRKNNASALPEA